MDSEDGVSTFCTMKAGTQAGKIWSQMVFIVNFRSLNKLSHPLWRSSRPRSVGKDR